MALRIRSPPPRAPRGQLLHRMTLDKLLLPADKSIGVLPGVFFRRAVPPVKTPMSLARPAGPPRCVRNPHPLPGPACPLTRAAGEPAGQARQAEVQARRLTRCSTAEKFSRRLHRLCCYWLGWCVLLRFTSPPFTPLHAIAVPQLSKDRPSRYGPTTPSSPTPTAAGPIYRPFSSNQQLMSSHFPVFYCDCDNNCESLEPG